MALLHVDFFSDVLGMCVEMDVILPEQTHGQIGMEGKRGDGKYPVLYLLHGMNDTDKGWYDRGHVKDVMDQLTASGEATPMIIVTPAPPKRIGAISSPLPITSLIP